MFDQLFENFFLMEIIIPIVDVILLAVIIYWIYTIFLQTRAVQLLRGLAVIITLYVLANFLRLQTVLWLLNILGPSLVIAIAIIFQPELRKLFTQLGQRRFLRFNHHVRPLEIEAVMRTAGILSQQKRGGLIVFVRSVGIKNIIETGTSLNADLSADLLTSIFIHDTPLHDGAAIIEDGRLSAAAVFLPLSERQDIMKSFGTRHRAALGLAEESDAAILVISEETGALSLAHSSVLYYDLEPTEIRSRLQKLLNLEPLDKELEN